MTAILSRALGLTVALCVATAACAESLNWYRGNTHTHTIHSDGDASPDSVARWYKEHGYEFLFITDHEYITDTAGLNALLGATERFLVLPGQEVTQWIDGPTLKPAHVNALFARQVIWPVGVRRCLGMRFGACASSSTPIADTFRDNIAAIRAQGAIAQINHPNLLWTVRPEDLHDVPDGVLIEVWNGLPETHNLGGSDGLGEERPSAEGFWDALLSRGKIAWGVGSDDSHRENDRARAWIVARAPALTPAAIRASIEQGRFYASTGVALDDVQVTEKSLSVQIKVEETIPGNGARYITRFIGQDGVLLSESRGPRPSFVFRGDETYVRASIIDSSGKRAWTQPIFRDARRLKTQESLRLSTAR